MKDVESVTGQMGRGETVTPAEEAGAVEGADGVDAAEAAEEMEAGIAVTPAQGGAAPPHASAADPWQALAQMAVQLVAAVASPKDADAPAHPWIERDPKTGTQSLRLPLPPPAVARQLADALSIFAEGLRGRFGEPPSR